ncbi:hypothetical protein FRC17_006033, partial [Serendipita sp. 399]
MTIIYNRVPLDWQDESKGMIPISVARLPASKTPRKGYMFYNPGGPGLPGTEFVQNRGSILRKQLGEDWDIISWDPRGVLNSGPTLKMFASDNEYDKFWGQLDGPGNYNTHGNLTTPEDAQFFLSQAGKFNNMTVTFTNQTLQQNGEHLKYVGTCAVVRDLVFLVDSLYGAGSDVNFWGISYGSAVGFYLTQMFPDRVGKVILDGVYDAEKHATLTPMKWLEQDYKTVEAALTKWTEACAESGRNGPCRFSAVGNAKPAEIMSKIQQILNTAYRIYDGTPLTISSLATVGPISQSNPRRWSYEYLIRLIRAGLYNQETWADLSSILNTMLSLQAGVSSKEVEIPIQLLTHGPFLYGYIPSYILSYSTFAIFCSDVIDSQGETTQELFNSTVQAAQTVSSNFAHLTPSQSMRSFCHQWKARAVERLSAPMNKKPKNVVLVIGNTGDPITPYESAQRIASSALLGTQARLVKFDTVGHSSFSGASSCIDNVVRNYLNGNPPKDSGNDNEDVACTVSQTVFGNKPSSW